jgi:flavin-dependent dehydrogenase
MNPITTYDVAIIGGGLAGLSLSILLARNNHKVIVIEKETYPHHKVCGEYISLESKPFLESLGLSLHNMQIAKIQSLCITSPNGKAFQTSLPLGGIGISRYTLDHRLAMIAKEAGVCVLEGVKVAAVEKLDTAYTLAVIGAAASNEKIQAKICAGSFGKRSNLDIKWKRLFLQKQDKQLDNYIGVKYHVRGKGDEALISLHNFENGYCGMSKIEDEKFCLCYLTTAEMLKKNGNNIEDMENNLLSRNPALKEIFEQFDKVEGFPVTISQISFQRKTLVENNVIFLGDAAGMITPLCGNGMSMALHASKLLAPLLHAYLQKRITYDGLVSQYESVWNKTFSSRLRTGRILQRFFGSPIVSNIFISLLKRFPFLAKPIIRQTHGEPF